MSDSRRAIDETKVEALLLPLVVNIETAKNLILKVVMDFARAVNNFNLSHPGDSQQHVLIVDEGLISSVQGLVIVPFGPVQAIKQRTLGKLFDIIQESLMLVIVFKVIQLIHPKHFAMFTQIIQNQKGDQSNRPE